MYEELKKKLPPGYLDREKVADFAVSMQKRMEKGAGSHKKQKDYEPLEEAQEECIDIAVYAMIEYFRIGRLSRKLKGGHID